MPNKPFNPIAAKTRLRVNGTLGMDELAQYSTVKVVALSRPLEAYDGWGVSRRTPVVGDVGTIVEILPGPAGEIAYVVECGRADGTVEWLCDFAPYEIVAYET